MNLAVLLQTDSHWHGPRQLAEYGPMAEALQDRGDSMPRLELTLCRVQFPGNSRTTRRSASHRRPQCHPFSGS